MKSIAVFFGGVSVEHDVSVITGVLTCNSVSETYRVVPVYVDGCGEWFTGDILRDPDVYANLDLKNLQKSLCLRVATNCTPSAANGLKNCAP